MNNTKLNPIYNALDGIDEDIAARVAVKRKPFKKIMIIAVAAAALAAIVGFTSSEVIGRHRFGFYHENSAGHAFDLKLTAREITVPDEFMPQDGYHFTDWVETLPGKLFEMFGLTLPINDNFTEIDGKKTAVDVGIVNGVYVDLDYTLYNKTIDSEVHFRTRYFSKVDNMTYQANQGLLPGEPSEVITLNDGSLCMVTRSIAVFSLDGAHCELELPYDYEVPENYGQLSEKEQYRIVAEMIEAMPGIDTVKQVLVDLEVYTPDTNIN